MRYCANMYPAQYQPQEQLTLKLVLQIDIDLYRLLSSAT